MNSTISEALAKAKKAYEEDAATRFSPLRVALDDAGVADVERVVAIRERIDEASDLLSCTSFDGTKDTNAEAVASALDSLFDAAESLCITLEELAKED